MPSPSPSPELDPTYESPDLTEADVAASETTPLEVADFPSPYQEVAWPQEFVLEDDSGAQDGPFLARHLNRDDATGAYVHQVQSRPLILRVVDSFDDDADIRCAAGDGTLWRYRVIPT